MTAVRHSNGFAISVPPGLSATETETGFRISPSNQESRRQVDTTQISIAESHGEGGTGEGAWQESRTVGEHTFHYSLADLGSGSGGTVWQVKGDLLAGERTLEVEHETQTESKPDLATLWQLLSGVDVSQLGSDREKPQMEAADSPGG